MSRKHSAAVVWIALGSISLLGCWQSKSPSSPLTASGQPDSKSDAMQATSDEPTPAGDENKSAPERLAPIGSFRGRDHTVIIYSTSDGPRFTVTTAGGEVLAERLSGDEIEAELPDVYKTYKHTFATSDNYLDARLDHTPAAPASMSRRYLDAGISGAR
jgi:hypothetical protein